MLLFICILQFKFYWSDGLLEEWKANIRVNSITPTSK